MNKKINYDRVKQGGESMIKELLKKYQYIIYMFSSFFILDFYLRNINRGMGFISRLDLSPNLFTLSWISLFIFIILIFHRKLNKVLYIGMVSFFDILFIVNSIYFNVFSNFFSFKNMGLAGEGTAYFKDILKYVDVSLVIVIIIQLILVYFTIRHMRYESWGKEKFIAIVLLFISILSYLIATICLGDPAPKGAWNVWIYKRNIYESFSDTRKSMQVSGYYEYVARDIYISYFKTLFEDNAAAIKSVKQYLKNANETRTKNDYKGIFKNKNLILVMMESVDTWAINDKYMPNLNRLMNKGLNFTNHFSPIYNGGATFNSEFMLNTGFMTPLNGESASSKYGRNYFPYSLPNLFNNEGYTANQIHENTSLFYNRGQMSSVFGYEHYYSSLDMGIDKGVAYQDTHFITHKKISSLLLPDHKFMSYVITYSMHMPYSLNELQCQVATTQDEKNKIANGVDEEEICFRAQARLTDQFFKELMDKLKKDGKLDDTVIIGVSDHYTYSYKNKKTIFKLKNAFDENMLHKTPFFIWSSNIEAKEITKANSNLDVFPTIAYLFGLDYNPKYYIGNNILDDNEKGFVFFADYSWYDGTTYYKNGKIVDGEKVSKTYINANNKKLNELLQYNENVLNSDYFRVIAKN